MLLVTKGTSSEGQSNAFNNLIRKYIDETAVAFVNTSQNQLQLADINSLSTLPGQGGQVDALSNLNTLQQNSAIPFSSVLDDFPLDIRGKNGRIVYYTVQPGDTLSFIASDFGVSINSIIWANKLRDADSIKPGDELRIPPVNGIIHRVVKGDTISSVAKKYGSDSEKIIEFNGLPQDGELRVDHNKLHKIWRTAEIYMKNKFDSETEWQIDVISVIFDKENQKAKIKHFKNIMTDLR